MAHGASLYFHHHWPSWEKHLPRTFPSIKNHVLLERASQLEEAKEMIQTTINKAKIEEIIDAIPEDWLADENDDLSVAEKRTAYIRYLNAKLSNIDLLAKEAADAR